MRLSSGFHKRSEFGEELKNFDVVKEDATSFRYSVLVLQSVAWLVSDVSLLPRINYVNDLCIANPIVGRLV